MGKFITVEKRRSNTQPQVSDGTFGFLMSLPTFVFMTAVLVYPLGYAFVKSFHDFNLLMPHRGGFIGLSNYITALASPEFRFAVKNTVFFTLVSVGIEFVLGLCIALMLARIKKFRGLFRTLLVTPIMMAPIVAGFMWRFVLSDQFGLVNHLLMSLGLVNQPLRWLTSKQLAMWSVIIADVWKTTPFMMLMLLTGLLSLPEEILQAADIDGASGWQKFRHIKLPLLKPVIQVALLVRLMDAFRIFGMVFVMTYGGPANHTDTLSFFIYRKGFIEFEVGYAAAAAFVMIGLMALGGLLLLYLMNRGSRDEA